MNCTTICISSQDGTGAEEVAPQVASALGFRLIDEGIVTQAAIEAGVDREAVADVERRKSTLAKLIQGMSSASLASGYVAPELVAYPGPGGEELRGLIRAAIEETAVAGSAVIVSHAASLALADHDGVLRVLLTAPQAARERRVAASREVDASEAARIVKHADAARADYIKRFYGVGTELPTHYDLVINTDKLEPARVAALILEAAGGTIAAVPAIDAS